MNPAVGLVIQDLIPMVSLIFRSFHAANGTLPTDEQVEALLKEHVAAAVAKADAFIASKG